MEIPPLCPLTKSTQRLLILGLIFFGWAVIVVFRLFLLQVLGHDRYAKLADSQQEKLEPVDALRGSIVDRNGNFLAISSASQIAVVNPSRISNIGFAAGLLGRVLQIDADKLQNDLEAAAASKRHRGFYVVDPHITSQKADQLRELKLDWLEIREGSFRSYPNGQLAAHVIGNVGGEGHGAAGLELKFDNELAGKPGLMRVKIDVKQRPYASEMEKTPTIGKNFGLTIDSQLQHVAEDAIRAAVIDNHGDHGSIVAMDPNNGEIFALANYPTYDPNERLHAGEKPHGREDLAVVAPYEPGSVFKVITLSAALETTRLTPQTVIPCAGGVITLFGRTIHDAEGHGDLSMADVLAKSSNVGAIRIGMEVGAENLYKYVRAFGVGSRTGIELPAEAPGMLRPLRRWQATSLPSVAFGHEVSVTTIQLARMGSVIANGGFLVHPHLIAWKQAPGSSKEVMKYPAPVQVLKPTNVMTMRQMMRGVVLPGGTAARLHLVGYTLAGKTGTAQIFDFAHHVYTHKYNASFLGFAPMNNPSILIVATVSGTTGTAGFGSSAAGPAFQTVATAALRLKEVPRDVPEEIEAIEQKLLAEKEKLRAKHKGKESDPKDDNDAVADLTTPLTEEEALAALGLPEGGETAPANADANLTGPKVPNFIGKTIKDVMQEAAANGYDVDLLGEGMARAQSAAPGSLLIPGQHIRVRFAR